MNAPDKIWLNDDGDYEGASRWEVGWCADPISDNDTEYTRSALIPAMIAEAVARALKAAGVE